MTSLKLKHPFFIILIILTIAVFILGIIVNGALLTKEQNDATAESSPSFSVFTAIVQLLIGTIAVFIPGYLLSKALIPSVSIVERIILSFAVSIISILFLDNFIIGALGIEKFEINEIFYELVVIGILSAIGIFGILTRNLLVRRGAEISGNLK